MGAARLGRSKDCRRPCLLRTTPPPRVPTRRGAVQSRTGRAVLVQRCGCAPLDGSAAGSAFSRSPVDHTIFPPDMRGVSARANLPSRRRKSSAPVRRVGGSLAAPSRPRAHAAPAAAIQRQVAGATPVNSGGRAPEAAARSRPARAQAAQGVPQTARSRAQRPQMVAMRPQCGRFARTRPLGRRALCRVRDARSRGACTRVRWPHL